MKKYGLALIITLFAMVLLTSVCFAQDTVIETPDVKVVIDGKLTTYSDVPLSVNGRTMLPLRGILNNLGVSDENILWDSKEKKVTFIKGATKVVLEQGSNKAYVNDAPMTLEVAPVGYNKNGRIYIPARFAAQALGKKVVWDGSSKSVLIREESEFNKVKDILDKSDTAMKAVGRAKFGMDVNISTSQNDFSMNVTANATGEMDNPAKTLHMSMKMNMLGASMNMEYYLAGGTQYLKNPMLNQWEKQVLPGNQFEEEFNKNTLVMNSNDPLCAGLVIQQSVNPDEILLAGDVYLDEFMSKANQRSDQGGQFEFDKYYMEVVLDKNTYLVKRINMDISGEMAVPQQKAEMNMKFAITYSEYNGTFEVKVPDEVVKSAVEKSSGNKMQY